MVARRTPAIKKPPAFPKNVSTDKKAEPPSVDSLMEKYKAFMEPNIHESGSISMDTVTGGGIPENIWIELASRPAEGKSTIILHISRFLCAQGKLVLYVDPEQGVNPDQIEKMGLAPFYRSKSNPQGLFVHMQPITMDEAEDILDRFLTESPALIVIDSITTLVPQKLLDTKVANNQPGVQAKAAQLFIIKYRALYKRHTKASFVLINQVRTKIRFVGASTIEPSGGFALQHCVDIRLMLEKTKQLVRKEQTQKGMVDVPYGVRGYIFALKNRFARPFVRVPIYIIFGKGVSNISMYKDLLEDHGIIVQGGGSTWLVYLYGQEEKLASLSKLHKWIKDHFDDVKKKVEELGGFFLVAEQRTEEDLSQIAGEEVSPGHDISLEPEDSVSGLDLEEVDAP